MNVKIDEYKDLCTNKNKMFLTVKKLLHDYLTNPNEAGKYYLSIMEAYLVSDVNTIFEHTETEVERLFLSSCLLKAMLDYPLLITFTNPFPLFEEARSYIMKWVKIHTETAKAYQDIAGERPVDYRDIIKSRPDTSEKDKEFIIQFYIQYIVFGFYNRFHISLKTTVADIIMEDQYFRPDILIWLPSNPNFKLMVEVCDLDYLLDKSTANEVKVRDQTLEAKGFQVIRFSKDEIEADPLTKSGELLKYLFDQR